MSRETRSNEDDEQTSERTVATSRRRFLEATGAAGFVGGASGFALAQQDGPTTYRFGGRVSGWQGRAPSAIEGEVNPTLDLEAGTEYEVVWENLDGRPHDFVIQDEQGNRLAGTEIMSEQGATRSFTFTASEEMAQYICTVHPSSMVGDVQIGQEDQSSGQQTPQPQQRFVPEGPTVGARKVADGPLVNPVTFRSVPGMDNTGVIVDQVGQVYLHRDGELRDDPILDLSDRVLILAPTEGNYERSEGFDERGLLGLDFHPDFQENGQFYVRYSTGEQSGETLVGPGNRQVPDNWDHVEVLSEFQMATGGDGTETATDGTETATETETPSGGAAQISVDPDSERVLLEVPEPQFNHNAGEVVFGPDGYLYTSLGDGGGANDTYVGHVQDWYDGNDGGNGQDVTDNLLGSILRIDVDGGASETSTAEGSETGDQQGQNKPYAVPDDNPLVGTDGMDEIWAWGLRNPWRMSFNDGQLVTADVGQALFEEVDVIEKGGNYGWNVREGFHCFDAANPTGPPDQCPASVPEQQPGGGQSLRDPVAEYPHTYQGDQVGISITGGYTYQGDQIAQLSDQYVFGDWSTNFARPMGRVFAATPSQQGTETATDGTETESEMPETETEVVGNVSVGQEAEGTPGGTTETDGTGTERTATEAPTREDIDLQPPSEQPWQYREVGIQGGENQQLNRFIQAFGRDDDGNVYVLASRTGRLTSEAGEVYRLVPAGEGDQISQPATPTPGDGGDGTETATDTQTGGD